jgi:hypothetical protein
MGITMNFGERMRDRPLATRFVANFSNPMTMFRLWSTDSHWSVHYADTFQYNLRDERAWNTIVRHEGVRGSHLIDFLPAPLGQPGVPYVPPAFRPYYDALNTMMESAFQPQTFMPPPGTVNHFWWNGRMDILWAPWAIERLPECCIPCYVALEARTNTSHYRVSYRIQTCFPWNMDNQIGWAARLDQAVAYAYSTVTVAAIEFLTRDEQGLQQALLQPGRRLHVPNQGERSSLTNISRMHLRFILQRRTMQNTLTTRVSNAVTFDSAGQNFEFITRLRGRRPLLTFAVEQGQYESELRREINLYDRILDMTDYSEVPQDDYEARYESAARQMFQTGAWNANTRLLVKERGDEPFFDQSDAQDEDVPFDWNLRGVLITFEDRNAIGYGLRMAGEPYTVPSQQFIGNYLANLRDGPELPWDAVIVLDEGEGDDVARVVIPERTYDMEQMQTVIHEFDQYWDTD